MNDLLHGCDVCGRFPAYWVVPDDNGDDARLCDICLVEMTWPPDE